MNTYAELTKEFHEAVKKAAREFKRLVYHTEGVKRSWPVGYPPMRTHLATEAELLEAVKIDIGRLYRGETPLLPILVKAQGRMVMDELKMIRMQKRDAT